VTAARRDEIVPRAHIGIFEYTKFVHAGIIAQSAEGRKRDFTNPNVCGIIFLFDKQ